MPDQKDVLGVDGKTVPQPDREKSFRQSIQGTIFGVRRLVE